MTAIMVQGTTSGAGKTMLVSALCRILANRKYSVAPFKSQNMSRYAYKWANNTISRAQAVQCMAARCNITTDTNPILLYPTNDDTSKVYLNGKFYKKMQARTYYAFAKKRGLKLALDALARLEKIHDVIVIEGAGSPVEINIGTGDIANMAIAEAVKAPVILVCDIERGGVFASIVGTLSLLAPKHKRLVHSLVINKFRGDEQILKKGYTKLYQITKKPILGTIPMMKHTLPEEDSIGKPQSKIPSNKVIEKSIQEIAKTIDARLDIASLIRMLRI